MELWIRSQDRQLLTKVDSLKLTNIGVIVLGNDVNGGIILGKYKPYERALEVLNKIQELINYLTSCELDYKAHNLYSNCVYEMPKE